MCEIFSFDNLLTLEVKLVILHCTVTVLHSLRKRTLADLRRVMVSIVHALVLSLRMFLKCHSVAAIDYP